MINARVELLEILGDRTIECAKISVGSEWSENNPIGDIILKKRYSFLSFREFSDALNFEYDNGFGMQELKGVVWLKDGT